ncbi:MAG: carboxypeptidase-like regulatory domain-containing protein [Candidatus Acidiferrales bacterium]
MPRQATLWSFLLGILTASLLATSTARADVYARIRGTVTDPTGAVVPRARIIATNTATGIATETISAADGSYQFPQLVAPGIYSVSAAATGFRRAQITGIHLSLNQILVANLKLELGTASESVTVSQQSMAQVEATSMELGVVVNSSTIINMPLNGRYWTDLMQLEPGVVSASDGRGGNGHGGFATNGSQADQNSYLINGTDNNDLPLNSVSLNPSPDAIAEFKMVTSTMNPEYGRNSGAILNAVIKSGTNQFHGDGFDFYRDTSLNARNYFQPLPAVFHRNTFGATIGGPIRKDHTFFFFSYQGTRQRRPETSGDCACASPGTVHVFSSAQRSGIFPDIASSADVSPFPLVGPNGITYPAGTAYAVIFPTGQIPAADINSVSSKLLSLVPAPTVGNDFEFNPVVAALDDEYLVRLDHALSSQDAIWGYFLWERYADNEALPFLGATLPGFAQTDSDHWQQYTLAWSHTFSPTTINEVRGGYTRLNYQSVIPATPASPSSVGFTGITPQLTSGEGLPVVYVTGLFDLGFSQDGPQPRIDQTYQFTDNFTKIVGPHALKFGFEMRRFEVYAPFASRNDGFFNFGGSGTFSTGDAGADFLLGIADSYEQGSGDILNERAQEYYSFAQDQWKVRPNLTLTYGMGWSIDTPMVDNYHDNHAGIAFRPGQQSTVFPTAPVGYVFQGDAGVNAFGTTKYDHFGPRVGFAYSPHWGPLTGDAGKTSIRAGYGIYYNRFNGETALQTEGSPPFAEFSFGIGDLGGSPSFANPFAGYSLGTGKTVSALSEPNKFPYTPGKTPDFSVLEPLEVSVYDPHITIPYSQNYNVTIQRQLGADTVLALGYVGAQGRHLLETLELNPGINPAGCAANPTCVSNRAFQPVVFPGNFKYPGDIFASVGDVTTAGSSNYDAFQTSLNKNLSHGLQFLASYTWSHALDISSGFENSGFGGSGSGGFGQLRSTNPFDPHVDYGSSNYDARHRLVISYVYQFPSLHRSPWMLDRFVDGWQISGITTFQSGFPLDVVDSSYPSLTSSAYTFYTYSGGAGWDVPNVVGPIQYMNPRTSANNAWVSPSAFQHPAFGVEGNAGRDILRGPGLDNFDFAVMKETKVTESTRIEMRLEFFNLFNHTQFDPNGITTDINSPAFGEETAAHDPRIIQLAGKFYF